MIRFAQVRQLVRDYIVRKMCGQMYQAPVEQYAGRIRRAFSSSCPTAFARWKVPVKVRARPAWGEMPNAVVKQVERGRVQPGERQCSPVCKITGREHQPVAHETHRPRLGERGQADGAAKQGMAIPSDKRKGGGGSGTVFAGTARSSFPSRE